MRVASFELTVPHELVNTARYLLPLCEAVALKHNGLVVALAISLQPDPLFTCHCIDGAGLPVAVELKQTKPPSHTVESRGCCETTGGVFTVRVAALEFTVPQLLVNTARY